MCQQPRKGHLLSAVKVSFIPIGLHVPMAVLPLGNNYAATNEEPD